MKPSGRSTTLLADRWTVVDDTRTQLGEGPLWSPRRNALFWVDILRHTIHERGAQSPTRHHVLPDLVTWIIECRSEGQFIVGLGAGFAALRLDPLRVTPLRTPDPSRGGLRMNDAQADARGRIYAGTMAVAADEPVGNLYRLDPDGDLTLVDSGYTIPNGPALSHDGRLLYHTDSARGLIFRFAVGDDGSLGAGSVFLEFPPEWGKPDGMTIDVEDHLWVAHWGTSCVSRFAPDGRRSVTVALPTAQITSCTFGGESLDRLYVTSAAVGRPQDTLAGALFEVDVGMQGPVPHTFDR
jgi:xylono-1,5-lactonase